MGESPKAEEKEKEGQVLREQKIRAIDGDTISWHGWVRLSTVALGHDFCVLDVTVCCHVPEGLYTSQSVGPFWENSVYRTPRGHLLVVSWVVGPF